MVTFYIVLRNETVVLDSGFVQKVCCVGFADRFVLKLINYRMISKKQFQIKENGAVLMKDDGRKLILTEWQKRKQEIIVHPFLGEKVEWGLVPYVQAMLLARYLRGDLEEYPPFLWK